MNSGGTSPPSPAALLKCQRSLHDTGRAEANAGRSAAHRVCPLLLLHSGSRTPQPPWWLWAKTTHLGKTKARVAHDSKQNEEHALKHSKGKACHRSPADTLAGPSGSDPSRGDRFATSSLTDREVPSSSKTTRPLFPHKKKKQR